MTFDDFIKKYTGVGIDTDGAYSWQCMDLLHKYNQDVLGLSDLSILAASNAKSVYNNFLNVKGHELFDKIANTPTGVPLKGDIVLYNWGVDGHVDIFVQGDVNSFRSFSQNFPTGSKSIVVNHPNYIGVLGWLRLKPLPTPPIMATITQADLDLLRKQRDDNWNLLEKVTTENETLKEKLAVYQQTYQQIADLIEKIRNI